MTSVILENFGFGHGTQINSVCFSGEFRNGFYHGIHHFSPPFGDFFSKHLKQTQDNEGLVQSFVPLQMGDFQVVQPLIFPGGLPVVASKICFRSLPQNLGKVVPF